MMFVWFCFSVGAFNFGFFWLTHYFIRLVHPIIMKKRFNFLKDSYLLPQKKEMSWRLVHIRILTFSFWLLYNFQMHFISCCGLVYLFLVSFMSKVSHLSSMSPLFKNSMRAFIFEPIHPYRSPLSLLSEVYTYFNLYTCYMWNIALKSFLILIPCLCLQKKQAEQILLNHQLADEISKIQQEAKLIQEIPKRLCESVEYCKDIYEDVLSIIQVKSMCHICIFIFYIMFNFQRTFISILS